MLEEETMPMTPEPDIPEDQDQGGDALKKIGGEPIEGSGFEHELPDPAFLPEEVG